MAPLFARRAAATTLVAGEALFLAGETVGRPHAQQALFAGLAGLLGLVAVGIGRRELTPHVLARGALCVGGAALALEAWGRHGGLAAAPIAAATLGALALTRPLLDTPEARRFAPLRFRGLLLAGSTAIGSVVFSALVFAIVGVVYRSPLQIGFNAAVAALLAISVAGLLRMRTWGVLLGAATSLGCLAVAPFYGPLNAVTLTLAALPALAFWVVPLLLARAQSAAPVAPELARGARSSPVRWRVAPEPSLATDEEPVAFDEAPLRARASEA